MLIAGIETADGAVMALGLKRGRRKGLGAALSTGSFSRKRKTGSVSARLLAMTGAVVAASISDKTANARINIVSPPPGTEG
jgi:hypothetical protein